MKGHIRIGDHWSAAIFTSVPGVAVSVIREANWGRRKRPIGDSLGGKFMRVGFLPARVELPEVKWPTPELSEEISRAEAIAERIRKDFSKGRIPDEARTPEALSAARRKSGKPVEFYVDFYSATQGPELEAEMRACARADMVEEPLDEALKHGGGWTHLPRETEDFYVLEYPALSPNQIGIAHRLGLLARAEFNVAQFEFTSDLKKSPEGTAYYSLTWARRG